MSSSDLFTADYPHGTPEGFDGPDGHDGCRGGSCPGADQWGLSCKRAKQLSRSDYQYQKLAAQGLTPAAIADELGLIPTSTTHPVTKRAPKPKAADHAAAKNATKAEIAQAFAVGETVLDGPADNLTAQHDAAAAEPVASDVAAPVVGLTKPTHSSREIRTWALSRGYEVKPVGKLPQHIIDHYWETHDLGATTPEVDTNTAQVDTEAPETVTIVPEPAGRRPDWSHVTLTEDLAAAQTDRDALAEELEQAQGELTRARGLAARLEEELTRSEQTRNTEREKHARETADIREAGLHLADSLRTQRDQAQRSVDELTTALAEANDARGQLITMLERGITTARIAQRSLELALRKWAAERERGDHLAEVVASHEWLAKIRREEDHRRLAVITDHIQATPNDDGIHPLGFGARIRRGWATTR